MRCEECGRVIDNAPTSRSMLQMCWECRMKGVPRHRQQAEMAPVALSETAIADINEAARAFQPGAA